MTTARHQPDAMPGYTLPVYPYVTPPELKGEGTRRWPVVVVGGGLTGLTLAADLGLRGIAVLVLDEDDTVGAAGLSSRGICYAKRSLEIFDRLGTAPRMMAKGVTWNEGRVHRDRQEVFAFNLQPEDDQKHPAFVNLQQFYVEQFLVERIAEIPAVDLRWRSKVTAVAPQPDHVVLAVETPEGRYTVEGDWVVACDGAHSAVRHALGLDPAVSRFEDQWCIADIRRPGAPGNQRKFWVDFEVTAGGAAILHRMADDVWRTDWQIGHYADPEAETTPARARERIRAMLGPDEPFELVWVGPWRFRSRLMERFVHGRVVFAGDAAHEVPPFGARGGNGGIQDADNLAWKLELVARGLAPAGLIDSYDEERRAAARENVKQACRSVVFLGPEKPAERLFRKAVTTLSPHFAFARPMINTGRLSVPCVYHAGPLNRPDRGAFAGGPVAGAPAPNGPVRPVGRWGTSAPAYLLDTLYGGFVALVFAEDAAGVTGFSAGLAVRDGLAVQVFAVTRGDAVPGLPTLADASGAAFRRYDAGGGAVYVLRPDGHVLARARGGDAAWVADAVASCIASR